MFEPKAQALRDLDAKLPEMIRLLIVEREGAWYRFIGAIKIDVTPVREKYDAFKQELAAIDARFQAQWSALAKERAGALEAVMKAGDPNSKRSRLAQATLERNAIWDAWQDAKRKALAASAMPNGPGRSLVEPARIQSQLDAIDAQYKPRMDEFDARCAVISFEPEPA